MAELVLPKALTRILHLQTLPHASLIVGGTSEQQVTLVSTIRTALGVASADTLHLPTPPAVAELRRVLERLVRTPHQSPCVLAVFGAFNEWSEELANVVLKTLEEPPAHARILLLASDDSSVLATIRSRVARFRLTTRVSASSSSVPITQTPLAQQFSWSQEVSAFEGVQESLNSALGATAVAEQRILLGRLTDIGSHPVNKRLALDAILTRRKAERTL